MPKVIQIEQNRLAKVPPKNLLYEQLNRNKNATNAINTANAINAMNAMNAMTARKFIVSGLVQGVGFRFFTQRAAAKHQVRGYVRNLPDGRVEAYAEAEEKAVEAFKQDLLTGPTYSEVEQIEETVLEPNGLYSSFRIER